MNQNVEERINHVVSSIVNCSSADVLPEKHLYYDLLADSLMMMDIMLVLEQEFSLNIKDDALDDMNYVQDIYRLIYSTKPRSAGSPCRDGRLIKQDHQ